MRPFVNLHNHSHYSVLDGYSSIDATVKRVLELNQKAIGLTDHGAMFGIVKFYDACKDAGIKPLIGMEAYVSDSQNQPGYSHMTILCKNNEGLNKLMKLSTKSHLVNFKNRPLVDINEILESPEGLIVTTSCLGGWLSRYYFETLKEHPLLNDFVDAFGEDFYFEIQTNSVPKQAKLNKFVTEMSNKYGGKLVACCDSHYPSPADYDVHDLVTALREGKNVDDSSRRLKHEHNDYYIHSGDEVYEKIKNAGAIENTIEIAEKCNVTLDWQDLMPKIGKDAEDSFLKLASKVNAGFMPHPAYEDRVNYELGVIKKLGFSDYFLIISEITDFCKLKGIMVGPGRGSGAGSLVCYLLGITTVDPIKYDLIFERFINPDRVSPPDLDLDFDKDRRDEVVQYVITRFGRDRVANIITFGSMAAKSAIKDVSRSFGVDFTTSNLYTKLFDEDENITIDQALHRNGSFKMRYENDTLFKKIVDISKKLEGLIRQPGQHAAGIVIGPDKIENFIPLYMNRKDNTVLTQFDMKDLERLGFLKMDFLGLRTLTVVQETLSSVGPKNDMHKFDDPKVFDSLTDGFTSGVFQVEGTGMTSVVKRIAPKSLEDLSSIIAIYRPGAMSGDMLNQFIENKNSGDIKAIHPALNEILAPTYGTLLYQESIMKMSIELGGFTGPESDTLRKALAKKHMELLTPMRSKFIDGCLNNKKHKISEAEAAKLFDIIENGGYLFNRAHSISYAMITYYTAYLKYYFKTAFMKSLMNSFISKQEKLSEYVNECKKIGIRVASPCINKSWPKFTSNSDNHIQIGLNAIKNVSGLEIIHTRLESSDFTDLRDFLSRISVNRAVNIKTLISLAQAGALDSIHKNRKECVETINYNLPKLRNSNKMKNKTQISMFESLDVGPEVTIIRCEDYTDSEKIMIEKEMMGYYVNDHPLERYVKKFGDTVGIVTEIKKVIDRKGNEMAFLEIEKVDSKIDAVLFSKQYAKYGKSLIKGNFIFYTVSKNGDKDNSIAIEKVDIIK